jgi:hypothetical protein
MAHWTKIKGYQMDVETAAWLAELIREASTSLAGHPGLMIEIENEPEKWVQIVMEVDDANSLSGFIINFPYVAFDQEPISTLQSSGLAVPPNTRTVHWESDGYATIWIRPEAPLFALALFIGDLFSKIEGVSPDSQLSVEIEYGF